MNTIAAAVTGARHLRCQRNGQDAAIALPGIVVVADGCSSGASSEIGARLGVTLFAEALATRLQQGGCVTSVETWSAVRADVARVLTTLLERTPGDRERAIHDMFLFTIVAAAATRDGAAVWALGDGAYSFVVDDRAYSLARTSAAAASQTRVLGPFPDNAPPYLGYDLLGGDLLGGDLLGNAREACFEVAPASAGAIVIATDGALDLDLVGNLDRNHPGGHPGSATPDGGLARYARDEYLEHPDKLRRELSLLARAGERIDWNERRVVRTPAVLQDDCAIGVLRRRKP